MLTTLSTIFRGRSVLVVMAVPVAISLIQAPPSALPEAAYRANNIGVAHLEQFDYPSAVRSFRGALEIAPDLVMARVNLAIALFYSGELAPARREAETALRQDPSLLQADYLLGLIARAENHDADAEAAFARVQRADPDDVGAAINLGQLYLQQQKFVDAIGAFRRASASEPYQSTAAYGLATALLRSGAREEGAAAMARFQQLRDSGSATTFSQNYLEQGRYAMAIASTGTEPELVDKSVPDVRFVEDASGLVSGVALRTVVGATLFDADNDGDLDLALATSAGPLFLRNERGAFADATAGSGLAFPVASSLLGLVAGDYDNDGHSDVLAVASDRLWLYHQGDDGTFADVTARAALPAAGGRTAAWSDVDHDGDLDIVLPPHLFRNNGNATFTDISASAGIAATEAVAIAPADFDNRRDVDFLVLRGSDRPLLFRNMRDGSFRESAEMAGLARSGSWTCVASGDINKDGFVDFFFGRTDAAGVFALSDGRGRFALFDAPSESRRTLAAQLVDYDNDGLLDLVTVAADGVRVWRNTGSAWTNVSDRAVSGDRPSPEPASAVGRLAAGDLDGDGDPDLVVVRDGRATVWRNEGANRRRSLAVRLSARVSNRSAVGARVEMRAGSLRQQIETASAFPASTPAGVTFGLGARTGADAVRVLWPSGILQAEVASNGTLLAGRLSIQELDRKPSSCPFLYTWNGSRFEFLTDFLGGGEMGYWLAPGVRNAPDPDEYVRIDSTQLQPRDGRYELRITNELEEALFLDRSQLIAITHPNGTDVYPNEGMRPDMRPLKLYVVRGPTPPVAAFDEHGHDILDRIRALDRAYADDFELERVRGYAKPHSITLTLPPRGPRGRLILLLTGWTDYAFSRDNVAASQQRLTLEPPSLQVRTADGQWRTVMKDIGVPVGRPQTIPVDLSGRLPAGATHVRIETTMRIYWDRILVDTEPSDPFEGVVKNGVALPLLAATLRWRGFSAETSADGREPYGYDYARVSLDSPWKLLPGRYTREGDVQELLGRADDMFVVARSGDEIALSFDASVLPVLPSGWTRTFLLHADGFSKEMDFHSSSPDELAPLPFHGMSAYPYRWPVIYPADQAHRAYVERYNTRVVPKPLPPLETAAPSLPEPRR